jgi:ribosomal protein S20
MAFGLIRVRELSASEVGATDIHNARKYEELGIKTPINIKKEHSDSNSFFYLASNEQDYVREGNLTDFVDRRIKEANCKVKANSVKAIEFVVGASPEFFDAYSASGHFSNCEEWLGKKYGKENIVARYDHYDESTPHAHFIIVPIISKEVRWKNAKGSGVKIENRLCARDITGTKEKLSQLQTDYFEFIKPKGAEYGVNFYRGTLATNQLKTYTKETNHKLGDLRNNLRTIEQFVVRIYESVKKGLLNAKEADLKIAELNPKIKEIQQEKNKLEQGFEELKRESDKKEARRENYNQGDKWKKGKDFSIGF